MICTYWNYNHYDGQTQTRYFKYSNPMFGKKTILSRSDSEWTTWCGDSSYFYKPNELKIRDRGGVCIQHDGNWSASVDNPKYKISKGDGLIKVKKYVLDFEFVSRKVEGFWQKKSNGIWTISEDNWVENWNCKVKDAPSPSIKGRIEGVIK